MRALKYILAAGALALAAASAGCANRVDHPKGLCERLQSQDDAVVARAAAQAGARRDSQTVPYLVKALESDAPDVRLFAIASLRNMTGDDLGYCAWADETKRQAAVERWRAWLAHSTATASLEQSVGE